MNRKLDIVVYGATGSTGKFVCEYIQKTYNDVRWAIVGHDKARLDELKKSLSLNENVGVFCANANDLAALQQLASQCRVVLNAAGPYISLGTEIIHACVNAGTHYVDVCCELPFSRTVIDKFHDEAAKRQIKIIQSCGYCSVPADVGSQYMVEELRKRHCENIRVMYVLDDMKGDVSGASLASMVQVFDTSSYFELLKMWSPFYLNPRDEKTQKPIAPHTEAALLSDASDYHLFGYDFQLHTWLAPYLLQCYDTRIVNRTNALTKFSYGQRFVFFQRTRVAGYVTAFVLSVVLVVMSAMMLTPITRRIVKLFLPSIHRLPRQELLDNGYFHARLIGYGNETESGRDIQLKMRIVATNGDPAYRQSAKMVVEAAVTLVQETMQLPNCFGVVTPAAGLGVAYRNRLQQHGIQFHMNY